MKSSFYSLLIVAVLSFNIVHGQAAKSPLYPKYQKLISSLKEKDDYPSNGFDTLIDLNGDHYKDILIEFYYLAGSGLKNGISVFLYDSAAKQFRSCEQLNGLANPTFYFSKKIVAGYYIANGGGSATKMKWRGLVLDTLEYIHVDVINKPDLKFKITRTNYITKKTMTATKEMMELPAEYNYWDYTPVIKKKDE